jgi:hypothetical protein
MAGDPSAADGESHVAAQAAKRDLDHLAGVVALVGHRAALWLLPIIMLSPIIMAYS